MKLPEKERHFISVDWGTSSLRLKLVETSSGNVIASTSNKEGIKETYNKWELDPDRDRILFYSLVLGKQLEDLKSLTSVGIEGLPICISGMASSSIGMKELPYASLPLVVDGRDLVIERIPASDDFGHDVTLISGVAADGDVMRGEEVQVIGWAQKHSGDKQIRLVLPGTHSKHILMQGQTMIDFRTYMTGELFELIRHHSILRSDITSMDVSQKEEAFIAGVKAVRHDHLTHLLFTIRARCLQGSLTREETGAYLSGLLIGSEFKDAEEMDMVIFADEKFASLYLLAARHMGYQSQISQISPEVMEQFVVLGQRRILETRSR